MLYVTQGTIRDREATSFSAQITNSRKDSPAPNVSCNGDTWLVTTGVTVPTAPVWSDVDLKNNSVDAPM